MPYPQIFSRLFLLFALLAASSGMADNVTFDLEPLDRFYGTPSGMGPGDFMFSEGGAGLWITDFLSGGTPYFNFAQIDPAFTGPVIYFGDQQILEINNVGVVFDFSSPGNVTFEYLDLGGSVNLQVNGHGSVLEAFDLISLAGVVAPGVIMTMVDTPVGGGHMAEVTLTGPVQRLRLGGQEFWLDNVHNDNGGGSGGDCDFMVDHQTLSSGMAWGDGLGNVPGDFIFEENGIPVHIGEIVWANGVSGFYTCEVMVPGIIDFGYDKVMNLNNVSNIYDIGALGVVPTSVSFEFVDYGGTENLMVNGHNLFVGDLDAFTSAVAPGVTLMVQTWPIADGGIRGLASLFGNVTELLVAGQEFFIDNICVKEDGFDPGQCDLVSDNESQPEDAEWSGGSISPGEVIFTEDGIDVSLEIFSEFGNPLFLAASMESPWCPIGSGNVLYLIYMSVLYDLTPFSSIQSVSFEFCGTGVGVENLGIDGVLYMGNILHVPVDYFPDVMVNINSQEFGNYVFGTVTLVGNVQQLLVGGQGFYVDNLCVNLDLSPVPDFVADALTLRPNYPNPFNPSTTLSFSLKQSGLVQLSVVDVAGRRIATLLQEVRSEGEHQVVWNGRDDHDRLAASGIYFVRLESGGQVATRKIEMLK